MDESTGRFVFHGKLNYSFTSHENTLPVESLNDIRQECLNAFHLSQIEDTGEQYSAGNTYFIKAIETPTIMLESLALSIFHHHTKDAQFDPSISGAEWWTQCIDPEVLLFFLIVLTD